MHGDKYDYSKVEYVNNHTKVCIICPKHGEFWQRPILHMNGYGCPKCITTSKGSEYVKKLLEEFDVEYLTEYKFDDCRNKLPLPFDFYIPDHNICIEYDGIQHFEPVEFFGGLKSFEHRKKLDAMKTNYCKLNDILLIRIRYDEPPSEIRHQLSSYLT